MTVARPPTVAWVLQAWPYADAAGQHRWLASLLASTAGCGARNVVLVPRAAGLPVVVRDHPDVAEVDAPGLRRIAGLRCAPPRAVAGRVAWVTYLRAPAAVQRRLAELRRARRRRQGVDHVLGRDWSPAERAWVEARLAQLRPDTVVFDGAFALAGAPPGARTLALAHDVIAERAASLAALGYHTAPAGIDAAWEADRLGALDGVVAIQADDAQTLRAALPGTPVVVAPPTFTPAVAPPRPEAGRLLVVGSGALHNVDGLRWFLAEVWPDLRRRAPRATLRVAGTVGSQIASPPEGVELLGVVDDLADEYTRAAVVVVPLRGGSGLKVKLAEALAAGVAVVTTSVGAQGLGHLSPPPFAVADDPTAMVDALSALLADLAGADELRRRAATTAALFSPVVAHGDLHDLIGCRPPAAES